MRKVILALAATAFVSMSCAKTVTANPSSSGSPSAASCVKDNLHLFAAGKLTVAADNPAYQPWFAGSKSAPGSPWKANPSYGTGDPYSGEGYEGGLAYAIAEQLGFSDDEVVWTQVNFNNSYKPGAKSFDFYIGQVSYSPERAQVVTFSDGYYNVQQALVANKGTPITNAKTFADLQDYTLGVQQGTTSYSYITNNIQPMHDPQVYDNSNDVIAALNAEQVDGYLVDAPDAYVNVLIGQAKNGVVVGQFPTIGDQEHYGLIFELGNPLVSCVNQAIAKLQADTIPTLAHRYLKHIVFPEITQ
jgi:polar amino acid transport system substrate-binding protein